MHELISSLGGRYALNDLQEHNSTLVGIDTDYMRNGRLFSEYRIRDAIDDRIAWLVPKGRELRVRYAAGTLDVSLAPFGEGMPAGHTA